MEDAVDLREVQSIIEESLINWWTEILGTDPIDREHDFFEDGGDSLCALQVIARIHDEFAVDLPLADFFLASRLADLSKLVARLLVSQIDADLLREVETLSGEQTGASMGRQENAVYRE